VGRIGAVGEMEFLLATSSPARCKSKALKEVLDVSGEDTGDMEETGEVGRTTSGGQEAKRKVKKTDDFRVFLARKQGRPLRVAASANSKFFSDAGCFGDARSSSDAKLDSGSGEVRVEGSLGMSARALG